MRPTPPIRTLALLALLAAAMLAWLAPGACRAQGVHVGVFPALSNNVPPGSQFDLELDVSQAGAEWNGFDGTVSFDPAALTLVPMTASWRLGCLMTGGCSAACGTTLSPLWEPGADSVRFAVSIICNQIFLTGPGQAYKLRFQASNTPQVTAVHIRRSRFARDGVYVNPIVTADATVAIGVTLGVGDDPPLATGLRVRAQPNPAHGPVALAISAASAGPQEVDVLDLSGRRVARLSSGWYPRGSRTLAWDGTDASGAALPAGIYLVRTRAGADVTQTRVTLLR